MKELLATTLASALLAAVSYGQGTVSFKNYFGSPTTDPRVNFYTGYGVTGSQYVVALMAGPTSGSEVQVATTTFLTQAAAAGFFQGGVVSIPTVPGGATAFCTIEVWDSTLNGTTTGATYAQAEAYTVNQLPNIVPNLFGSSVEFAVVTGNPNGNPPTPPAFLVPGLTSFSLSAPIPEPSGFTLMSLGAATLMIFRRRG